MGNRKKPKTDPKDDTPRFFFSCNFSFFFLRYLLFLSFHRCIFGICLTKLLHIFVSFILVVKSTDRFFFVLIFSSVQTVCSNFQFNIFFGFLFDFLHTPILIPRKNYGEKSLWSHVMHCSGERDVPITAKYDFLCVFAAFWKRDISVGINSTPVPHTFLQKKKKKENFILHVGMNLLLCIPKFIRQKNLSKKIFIKIVYQKFYQSIQPKQRKQDIPIKSLMLMYYSFYVIIIANLFAPKRPSLIF